MAEDEHPTSDAFGASRRGPLHRHNSDQFLVAEIQRAAHIQHASAAELNDSHPVASRPAQVLAVADGVNGHTEARTASRYAVEALMDGLLDSLPWSPQPDWEAEGRLRIKLRDAFRRCDRIVQTEAARSTKQHGMASTLTLAFVRWPECYVVHAGDSRAYLIRGHDVRQLTEDHSMAARLTKSGSMTREQAAQSPLRHLLWNTIGGPNPVSPELVQLQLRPGDTLLLCSDGLTRALSGEAIRKTIAGAPSSESACDALLAAADGVNAADDVTVAMARFRYVAREHVESRTPPPSDSASKARQEPSHPPVAVDRSPVRPLQNTEVMA